MIDEMRTHHAEEQAETEIELEMEAPIVFTEGEPPEAEAYRAKLHALQKRLHALPAALKERGQSMMLAFEGWDAAGKSGAIRRITDALREDRVQVFGISAPTGEEKARHYLWRFWRTTPPIGHIAIYDRSWYGRVMVERVEGLAHEEEWRRAYGEIRDFERTMVENGCMLRKFWLEISEKEQLARFEARRLHPEKRHKLTAEDWRNRSKREAYEHALADMLRETDTSYAPWEIIDAENKKSARLLILESILHLAGL